MNTEQERAAFEAWITASPYEKPVNLNPDSSGFPGQYRAYEVQLAWEAWQARAALQSQDREDAERYRRLRKGDIDDVAVVRGLGAMDYGASAVIGTYSEEIDGDDLDAAIDHARRAEGGGKGLTPAEDRKVKPGDVVEITSPWLSGGLYDVGDRFVVTEVQEGSGVFFEYPGHTGPVRVFLAEWEYRLV